MEKIHLVLFVSFLTFSSCSLGKTGMETLLGNYSFQKGNYQKAMVYYLNALKQNEFTGLINYNLGNLYFSLGEPDTAKESWDSVEIGSDKDLMFRIFFNKGVYYYEKGQFQDAFLSYRNALFLKPQDVDAKINLELSYRKILSAERTENIPEADTRKMEDNSRRVLQYVQRKEELFWSEKHLDQKDTVSENSW